LHLDCIDLRQQHFSERRAALQHPKRTKPNATAVELAKKTIIEEATHYYVIVLCEFDEAGPIGLTQFD
jgi:hypothetical protein